jgi:hypothetical protein
VLQSDTSGLFWPLLKLGSLVPISSAFHSQLLLVQIPKAQKDSQVVSDFFAFLGSVCTKAGRNIDEKLAYYLKLY